MHGSTPSTSRTRCLAGEIGVIPRGFLSDLYFRLAVLCLALCTFSSFGQTVACCLYCRGRQGAGGSQGTHRRYLRKPSGFRCSNTEALLGAAKRKTTGLSLDCGPQQRVLRGLLLRPCGGENSCLLCTSTCLVENSHALSGGCWKARGGGQRADSGTEVSRMLAKIKQLVVKRLLLF